MNKVTDNNTLMPNGLVGQLVADKKKAVIALVLIGVMAIMWVKAFTADNPKSADAAVAAEALAGVKTESKIKITFKKLPKVTGRNDILARDFFVVEDWQKFVAGEKGENVSVVEGGGEFKEDQERTIRRVASKLRLEAIGLGARPQAFINDKLLAVGDKLIIEDGKDVYECEIVGIEVNTVTLICEEAEIILKIAQPVAVDG